MESAAAPVARDESFSSPRLDLVPRLTTGLVIYIYVYIAQRDKTFHSMAENMFCQTEKHPKNITLIAISRVWLWAARHEIYGVDRCFSRVTFELLTKEALRVTVIDCAVNLCGLVGVACPAACHVWGDCFCF